MGECPHTQEIGGMKERMMMLEKKLEALEAIAKSNAEELLTNKVEWAATKKWLDIIARLIGYCILIGALFAAGKVAGFADLVLKLFKS